MNDNCRQTNNPAVKRKDCQDFVIYNCTHIGSFFNLFYLRLTWHRKEKAILLYYDETNESIKKLEECGLFDKIIFYDRNYKVLSKNNLEKIYVDYFDDILSEHSIDIKKATNIYTACDHFDIFAIYLYFKKIKYTVFEIVPGQFNQLHRCIDIVEGNTTTSDYRISKELCDLQMKIGNIRGKGDFYTIRYEGEQTTGNTINFEKLFDLVSEEDCNTISSLYELKELFDNTQLLLTNSWYASVDWSRFSEKQYLYPYQLIVDYLCDKNEKITIKLHPHNNNNVSKYFKNCLIADSGFPIQLILFDKSIKIQSVFGSSSSSVVRIKPCCVNDMSMGFSLNKLGHYFHHIVAISNMIVNCSLNKKVLQRVTETPDDCQFIEKILPKKCETSYYDYSNHKHNCTYICENVLFTELFPDNDYFLLDYDNTGWCNYLLDAEMGIYKITITITPNNDDFIGEAINNSFYLLSNKTIITPNKNCYNLETANATAIVSYSTIKKMSNNNDTVTVNYESVTNPTLKYRVAHIKRNEGKIDSAAKLFKESAHHEIWACFEWFDMLAENDLPCEKIIIELLEKYSNNKEPEAMFRMGNAYRRGWGVPKDIDKASEYYSESSTFVKWSAINWYDMLRDEGMPSNDDLITILRKYADDGDYEAMFRMGNAYRRGWGVPKDIDKASEYYSESSKMIRWACFEWYDMLRDEKLPYSKNLISLLNGYAVNGDYEAIIRYKKISKIKEITKTIILKFHRIKNT